MPKEKKEKGEKKKRAKKERDPNAPKRATTAYFLYCAKARPDARKVHPEMKVTEIAKILAEQWRNLSADEKKPFLDQANIEKERYQKAKAAYDATKKSGGKASKDDDEDEEEEEQDDDD